MGASGPQRHLRGRVQPRRVLNSMDAEAREACTRYVAELFAPEDEVLEQLRGAIAKEGLPEIYISADEGRLLQVLLRAINARTAIELGTLGGYSTIWLARALPADGKLITVEIDRTHAELAQRFIERAGLAQRVELRVGVALEVLAELAEHEPFDAAFIDADKENYPRYLDWCLENVRPGGLVIADNAFRGGDVVDGDSDDPEVVAIRQLNRRMAEDPRLTSIVVPTRDGVAIGVVNRG